MTLFIMLLTTLVSYRSTVKNLYVCQIVLIVVKLIASILLQVNVMAQEKYQKHTFLSGCVKDCY